jgi:glycerol-3-phosphate acyltransferase PlsY
MIPPVAVIVASYLAGSIPMAYIVTRIAAGKDIRSVGSGNPGATNVFRALGPKFAVPVFAFDFAKGFIPVLWVLRGGFDFSFPPTYIAIAAGAAAITGHVFPVFLRGKGGKGVATGAGVISALFPPIAPACLAIFLAVLFFSRKMSLASLSAAIAVPPAYVAISLATGRTVDWILFVFFSLVSALVFARHRKNVRRLRDGTEQSLFRDS